MLAKDRIIFAADMEASALQQHLAGLNGAVGVIKLGQEIVTSAFFTGVPVFEQVCAQTDLQIMYDIKADDIPTTVQRMAMQVAKFGAGRIFGVTVHCSAGREALELAVQEIERNFSGDGPKPMVIAVTLLTSMKQPQIDELGIQGTPEEIVGRWAAIANDVGASAVVCSAMETSVVRKVHPSAIIINPAIRFSGSDVGTQNVKRVTTPGMAIDGGANYIVMGSDLKKDPVNNARKAATEIEAALGE
jgi:orotidine-5'-phosphate decarboxylase